MRQSFSHKYRFGPNGGPLRTSGASRLVCLLTRSKHKVVNDFPTSLEEAGVSRPGRKAGNKNGQTRRAPKVRHRNRADRDSFAASEIRRATSLTEPPLRTECDL